MKIIKKYWKNSSRGREVGVGEDPRLATRTWTDSKIRTIPILTSFLYYCPDDHVLVTGMNSGLSKK